MFRNLYLFNNIITECSKQVFWIFNTKFWSCAGKWTLVRFNSFFLQIIQFQIFNCFRAHLFCNVLIEFTKCLHSYKLNVLLFEVCIITFLLLLFFVLWKRLPTHLYHFVVVLFSALFASIQIFACYAHSFKSTFPKNSRLSLLFHFSSLIHTFVFYLIYYIYIQIHHNLQNNIQKIHKYLVGVVE